jgi:hypothetical protein
MREPGKKKGDPCCSLIASCKKAEIVRKCRNGGAGCSARAMDGVAPEGK